MIQPTRLPIDLAWSSKPSSQRNRLVARSSEPFTDSQESHILSCVGPVKYPHRGPPGLLQHLPTLCSLFGVADSPIKTHSSDTKQRLSPIHFYLTCMAPIT